MKDLDLEIVAQLATKAALEAGQAIVDIRNSGEIGIGYKGARNIVTRADLEAERIIIGHIQSNFPEHKILSEESAPTLKNSADLLAPLWIIDPIDGTTNYAHGHSQCAVCIAFAVEGKVLFGIVHAPFKSETYMAKKGGGATLNGEHLQVSAISDLQDALIATGFPYSRNNVPAIVRKLTAILANCKDIRRAGAASLDACWVAAGKLEGYYETVSPWDIAAAGLIAREAGAVSGTIEPVKDKLLPPDLQSENFLVANPLVFEKLKAILTIE